MKNFKLLLILFLFGCVACSESFLDIKPDKKLVVPSTLDDLQALTDYFEVNNANMPGMGGNCLPTIITFCTTAGTPCRPGI